MSALALAIAVMLDREPPPAPVAFAHAELAARHADPALLLAIAHAESRHRPGAVSRLECAGPCRRRASIARGRGAHWRPPYFCGVTQVHAASWRGCRRLLGDDALAFERAAAAVTAWLQARPCRKRRGQGPRIACALAGYGAGTAAARRGSSRYARRVMVRRARIDSMARAIALVLR